MKHGSLFSGIGGFDLAAEWMGWDNVFHCEWNDFGKKILNYYWPKAISYDDITKTDFTIHRGAIDILTGGFPCQDASIAKQWGEGQQGLLGERTSLAFHMLRATDEIRPKFIVAENVGNFLSVNGGKDFRTILGELAGMGYNAEWRICRSSDVGAPHHRERMYLVAYPVSLRLHEGQTFFSHVSTKASQVAWVSNGTSVQTFRGGPWLCEPPTLCVDDGISETVAGFTKSQWRRGQIQAFGNSVTPYLPYCIFKSIQQYEKSLI